MRSDNTGKKHDFATQLESVYSARGYDQDRRYSEFSPTYLQRVQSMEAAYLGVLNRLDLHKRLDEARVLDFGCGNGHWMARIVSWGYSQDRLFGVDVREQGVRAARRLLPGCRIERSVDGILPYATESFELCFVNLVFSSILEDARRMQAANELQRVTARGGIILTLDFRFNNPSNPDVRMVRHSELQALFAGCTALETRSLVLAPPIASRIVSKSRWLAAMLESLPFLRTHFLSAFRKSA